MISNYLTSRSQDRIDRNKTVQTDDALLRLQTDVHNYFDTVLLGELTGPAATD